MSVFVIGPVPVFDPELEALTGDRFIIVEDGTIVDVLDASASVPSSATRIAAEGKAAIPGSSTATSTSLRRRPVRFAAQRKNGNARRARHEGDARAGGGGVATVRDCGAPDGMVVQLRDAVDQG